MSDISATKGIVPQGETVMKGWLFKWTNYLKGYQRRWFVLQNSLLSYYRAENNVGPKLSIRRRRRHHRNGNQAEMAHTCRGTISLHGALIHTVDSCTFVISNGGTQTFHIKAASEIERQSWVTALELAKARAIRTMESEDDEEQDSGDAAQNSEELNAVVRELVARLEDMQTCSELIAKHGATLQRLLGELEQQPLPVTPSDKCDGAVLERGSETDGRSKAVGERATLFRIASNAMINACSEYLAVAQTQGHKWMRVLQHEREQRQRLEDMVEQLARQHSHLEMAASAHATGNIVSPSDEDEENEFYDCDNDGAAANPEDNSFIMNIPMAGGGHQHARRNSSDSSENEDNPTQNTHESQSRQVLFVTSAAIPSETTASKYSNDAGALVPKRMRRVIVPEKPNYPLNLWSIMKNCIGKDLSKIPMPVNFSEPLSMLQRLTEDYEYADILDVAAGCDDPCEQLAYVAAFTVSSYSTTSNRTGKPFNPLLGETYECDRMDDLGWRAISEQVSHHPPMVAQYCEGRNWRCWQEFTMTSKFRGKYLQVIPLGTAYVEFLPSGNRYTWRKVTTTVHNIIVGKLWVDHHGDMEIVGRAGQADGVTCHLKYIPYSYFTRDTQRRVKGCVVDALKTVKWVVTGTWDNKVDIAPVTGPSAATSTQQSQSQIIDTVFQTGPAVTAWKRRPPPDDCSKYYGFTVLAAQLNEPEEGVAPTDSRLRPDQRLMEDGKWDEANSEKVRLEEKQRAVRRRREAEHEEAVREGRPFPPYEPLWFVKQKEEDSDVISHVYKGNYWESKEKKDWARCPDIF